MEDFQAMRAFGRVAELGSFTRAADELGLSRAMVTTHVQRLEKRFGLRLLNRTTRKVAKFVFVWIRNPIKTWLIKHFLSGQV
jgi:DNA-binding MarR family transcriptional regulator